MSHPGDIGNPSDLADFVLNRVYAPAADIPDRPEDEWIPVYVRIDWRLRGATIEKGIVTQWTHDRVRVTVVDQSAPIRPIWLDPSNVRRRED